MTMCILVTVPALYLSNYAYFYFISWLFAHDYLPVFIMCYYAHFPNCLRCLYFDVIYVYVDVACFYFCCCLFYPCICMYMCMLY